MSTRRGDLQARVALLIETSTTWGTQLIQGVARYANSHGWRLDFEPAAKHQSVSLSPEWTGTGIIGRITTKELAEQVIASGVPAVNVSWYEFGCPEIPRCIADFTGAAYVAAEHFLERGIRSMAYCGSWRRRGFTDRLFASFQKTLGPNFRVAAFQPHPQMSSLSKSAQIAELARWIRGLPRRVGLFAFDSEIGYLLSIACLSVGRSIPEDVAILTGENDELLTLISSPQLSAIDLAPQSVGYSAAAMLDRILMTGNRPDDVLVPPAGVIRRHSTDLLSHPDSDLAAALRFIRQNAHRTIRVDDILCELTISRRKLEQKFKALLARSPSAEIRRERVDRAKRLLRTTRFSLNKIALSCGFESGMALTQAFRREVGMCASAFRRMQG